MQRGFHFFYFCSGKLVEKWAKMAHMRYLFGLLLFCSTLFGQKLELSVQSRYAVLMNIDTRSTLYEKRGDVKIFPASTTKMATILYAMHRLSEEQLDEKVIAPAEILKKVSRKFKDSHIEELPPYILQSDGTTFGIVAGEMMTMRDLLYGLLIASGNDAANVIAYHLGDGSIEKFMEEMNHYLYSIGCHNSHFVNPHGLHHPDQYSTPYEMALIGVESLKYPLVKQIIQTQSYDRPKTNKQKGRTLTQPNKLIKKGRLHFDEAFGMKTGYTADGGYCLLASASDGKRGLVAALYDAKEDNFRYRDAIEMFTRAFEEKAIERKLFNRGGVPFVEKLDEKHTLKMVPHEDVLVHYFPSESPHIATRLILEKSVAPINKGERVAHMEVSLNQNIVKRVPLFATKEIAPPTNWWWAFLALIPLYVGYRILRRS